MYGSPDARIRARIVRGPAYFPGAAGKFTRAGPAGRNFAGIYASGERERRSGAEFFSRAGCHGQVILTEPRPRRRGRMAYEKFREVRGCGGGE